MSTYDRDNNEDTTTYKVVVNHEEQYSLWPAYRANALGWNDTGKSGTKEECLAYVKEVWTDMRPLSLRKKMEEMARLPVQPPVPSSNPTGDDDLVTRLSSGDHPVEVKMKPERSALAFRTRLEEGFVRIKFTDTKGGTELGFKLIPEATDTKQADFDNQKGTVHLEGKLTLDFRKVRCAADIDLETLKGRGRLYPLEA